MSSLFISYSRKDQAFVRRLYDALTASGHTAFVDWEGIPASAEWMREIQEGIDRADAIVCILSPDYVTSPACLSEIQSAEMSQKRLIPVVYREVTPSEIPAPLAKLNWIFMRESDDFASALSILQQAIATDLDYVHTSAQLLVRAKEWEVRRENASLLLRGATLQEAEAWLAGSRGHEPAPSQLQTRYIVTSRQISSRRQRSVISVLSVVLAIMVVLTATTLLFYRQARVNEDQANINAQTAHVRALSANSLSQNLGNDLDKRLLESLLAVNEQTKASSFDARNSLMSLVQSNQQVLGYLHTPGAQLSDGRVEMAESDDGTELLTYSQRGLFAWTLPAPTLRAITTTTITPKMIALPQQLYNLDSTQLPQLAIDADGSYAVIAGVTDLNVNAHDQIIVFKPRTGEIVAQYHGIIPSALAMTADGQHVAAGVSLDTSPTVLQHKILVWDVSKGPTNPTQSIDIDRPATSLAFSPDGSLLAFSYDVATNKTVLWNLASNQTRPLVSIEPQPDTLAGGLAFSADGNWLVVSGDNDSREGETAEFSISQGEATLVGVVTREGAVTRPEQGDFYLTTCLDPITCTQAAIESVSPTTLGTLSALSTGPENILSGVGVVSNMQGIGLLVPLVFGLDNGSLVLWAKDRFDIPADAGSLPDDGTVPTYLSPNGHYSTYFLQDGTLRLWDAITQKPLTGTPQTRGIMLSDATVETIGVSNDGTQVAALDKQGQIVVHHHAASMPMANPPAVLQKDQIAPHQLAFDWQGQRLAALTCIAADSTCATASIDVWDTASGRLIVHRTIQDANSIAFRPQGHVLAIGGRDSIRFFDWSTNQVTTPIIASGVGSIVGLAFDASGTTIAGILGQDRSTNVGAISLNSSQLELWDVERGQQLGLGQSNNSAPIDQIAFDDKGNVIVFSGAVLKRFYTGIAALQQTACAMANRNLTADEWQELGAKKRTLCPMLGHS